MVDSKRQLFNIRGLLQMFGCCRVSDFADQIGEARKAIDGEMFSSPEMDI
jgi:hypothetical protein